MNGGPPADKCALTDDKETEERALSSPRLTWDDMHHSDGPGSLVSVSFFRVQSLRKSPHGTWICTDSSYILEEFRVLVFQRWRWLVLRCDSDKRNQRGQRPCPLRFPLWTLIHSVAQQWLLRTWKWWPAVFLSVSFLGAGLVTMRVFHPTSSHLPPTHPTALDHRTTRSTPLISLSPLSLFLS